MNFTVRRTSTNRLSESMISYGRLVVARDQIAFSRNCSLNEDLTVSATVVAIHHPKLSDRYSLKITLERLCPPDDPSVNARQSVCLCPMVGTARVIGIAMLLFVSACTPGALRKPQAGQGTETPYPFSRLVSGVTWDFSEIVPQRKALGSDLWPCAWAADGDLYCAWGDGGGFDGNDDNIGRVSVGFARITGIPISGEPSAITGKNVWGAPPYAESAATFGGKVGSMTAVNGILYAYGGFWTGDNSQDPVHTSGRGRLNTR